MYTQQSSSQRSEISAGVICYTDFKNIRYYLLILSSKGNWDFPKGHQEEGETLGQTALRETQEETGLIVNIQEHLHTTITYTFRDKTTLINKKVILFAATLESYDCLCPVTTSYEHRGYAWCSGAEAQSLLTFESGRGALRFIITQNSNDQDQ
jgi:8-oxo-dGTP pyrophosphatase MutT (NUDIX family)